ncbi:MAG: hypothetical protein ICV72_12095 [Aldersonia sp.]|nr:hypothetical protein [Aldersonia sp.]
MTDIAFDAAIDEAWTSYRGELADRLAALADGESLEVGCDGTGAEAAVLRFRADGDEMACEVPPNRTLPASQRLDAAQGRQLIAQGWRRSRSRAYSWAVDRRRVDELACRAVTVLREFWQVPHPAFLDPMSPGDVADRAVVHLGTEPRGRADLLQLVHRALARMIDDCPEPDDVGDIPLGGADSAAYLHVLDDAPIVEFVAILAEGNPDPETTMRICAEEGPHWPDIRFDQAEDYVAAALRVDMTVFVEANLWSACSRWSHFMAEGAPAIVDRLHAEAECEAGDEPLPPALMSLLQLDADGAGTLAPHEVAAVCDYDRDAILGYIAICEEQQTVWRSAAEDAEEADERAACLHEARAWAATAKCLRGGLRAVLLPR